MCSIEYWGLAPPGEPITNCRLPDLLLEMEVRAGTDVMHQKDVRIVLQWLCCQR